MKFIFVLALCCAIICPCHCAPNATNNAAAYQSALPLYADNPHAPLLAHVSEQRVFPDCRLLRLTYAGAGAKPVPALLFLPQHGVKAHNIPCVVVLHGLGGTKEQMSGLCRYLATAGYASLAIDLYGHGERVIVRRPGNMDILQLQTELRDTVTITAVDVRRGIDYLQSRPEINRQRIGLAGFSLGAIIGSVAAGVDTRIKATALVSGGGGWGEILKSLSARYSEYQGQRVTGQESVDWTQVNSALAAEDPLTFAPHIAPRALLMINGTADTTILPSRAQALYEAAHSGLGSHAQMIRLQGAGHLPPIDTVFPELKRWLALHL